ncbi:MAG TPA: hypothetical protein VKX49_11875 [Bryobacteraceae bacterium]|nr:hypothetical protein [Bryobacteraceae bacterium]
MDALNLLPILFSLAQFLLLAKLREQAAWGDAAISERHAHAARRRFKLWGPACGALAARMSASPKYNQSNWILGNRFPTVK